MFCSIAVPTLFEYFARTIHILFDSLSATLRFAMFREKQRSTPPSLQQRGTQRVDSYREAQAAVITHLRHCPFLSCANDPSPPISPPCVSPNTSTLSLGPFVVAESGMGMV